MGSCLTKSTPSQISYSMDDEISEADAGTRLPRLAWSRAGPCMAAALLFSCGVILTTPQLLQMDSSAFEFL
jgi:hypothetical protein